MEERLERTLYFSVVSPVISITAQRSSSSDLSWKSIGGRLGKCQAVNVCRAQELVVVPGSEMEGV